ncbi:hypothetical protein LTR33_006319 [Friedmanniomyces endolithicus]|nr:hypothetical protein LTR33_006319 [Friedmanniomyces endolithicus]
MPIARGISFSMLSQYDARALPESPLRPLDQARPGALIKAGNKSLDPRREHEAGDEDEDEQTRITAVTIPIYPGSQFWMSYRCPRPPPPSSGRTSDTETGNDRSFQFWYFKVFVAGGGCRDVCLVSWSVGEREEWSGKTVLALFEGRSKGGLEKRGFFFAAAGARARAGYGGGSCVEGVLVGEEEGEAMLEVRVYRSWARKRERSSGGAGVGGFEEAAFRGAGFEYYAQSTTTRSNSPLLGLTSPEAEDVQARSAAVSGPEGAVDETPNLLRRDLSVPPRGPRELRPRDGHGNFPVPIMKRGHRKSPGDGLEDKSPSSMHGSTDGDKNNGPPSDWGIKTPSPVKTDRVRFERASTPPSARAKNGSISLLRGVIANALRRRDGSGSGGVV